MGYHPSGVRLKTCHSVSSRKRVSIDGLARTPWRAGLQQLRLRSEPLVGVYGCSHPTLVCCEDSRGCDAKARLRQPAGGPCGGRAGMRHARYSATPAVIRITRSSILGCSPFSPALFAGTTRYATKTVFNRQPPLSLACILRIAWVTRPLQLLWRVLTFWARVPAPDVYVLGEARCGTTTLCALLRSQLGMLGAFSIWDHPLANDKESFYFVGHIFGIVSPLLYRICLPLKLRRPAVVFEGCASYLCAPWCRCSSDSIGGGGRRARRDAARARRAKPFVVAPRAGRDGVGNAMGLGDDYSVRGAAYTADAARRRARARGGRAVAGPSWRWRAAAGVGDAVPAGQLCAFDAMGRVVDSILRWQAHMPDATFVFVTLDELCRRRSVLQRIADAVARSGALGGDVELEAKLRAAADAAPATAAPPQRRAVARRHAARAR